MHREMYNLIRAVMVILAILTFTVLCLTDESRNYPQHQEPTSHPSTQTERP